MENKKTLIELIEEYHSTLGVWTTTVHKFLNMGFTNEEADDARNHFQGKGCTVFYESSGHGKQRYDIMRIENKKTCPDCKGTDFRTIALGEYGYEALVCNDCFTKSNNLKHKKI